MCAYLHGLQPAEQLTCNRCSPSASRVKVLCSKRQQLHIKRNLVSTPHTLAYVNTPQINSGSALLMQVHPCVTVHIEGIQGCAGNIQHIRSKGYSKPHPLQQQQLTSRYGCIASISIRRLAGN